MAGSPYRANTESAAKHKAYAAMNFQRFLASSYGVSLISISPSGA